MEVEEKYKKLKHEHKDCKDTIISLETEIDDL